MKKMTLYTKGVMLIAACAVSCLGYAAGISTAYAQSPFNLSISGDVMPQAGIEDSDAGYASQRMNVELSLVLLNLGYTFTEFDWDKADQAALGNGHDAPWEQLQQLTIGSAYMADIDDRWSYLMVAQGTAGFENSVEQSFQEWMAIAGGQYTLSERWKLLFGGGVKSNDFETVYVPAGGFQWDAGHGISLSMIFPKETMIQYVSANQKFSAFVNFFPDSSAEIAYAFSPSLKTTVRYTLSELSTYRLADDSPVKSKPGRTYLETDAQALNLDLSYTPFRRLTCGVGLAYRFQRTLSILDDDEHTLETLDGDDSVGASVKFTYNF